MLNLRDGLALIPAFLSVRVVLEVLKSSGRDCFERLRREERLV